MNALVEQTAFGVTTNSRTVAEVFCKEHAHVLRDIDIILKRRPDLSGRKFVVTSVDVLMPKGGTRSVRAYEMDRDGFTLLVMGFTGEEALDWKLTYIDAFNRMEEELARQAVDAEPKEARLPAVMLPPLGELTRKVAVADAYRRLWGPDAGRWMIAMLGLPVPETGMISVEPEAADIVADSVATWIEGCCEKNGDAKETASNLYNSYQLWCAENRRIAETQTGFGRALSRLGVYGFKSGGGRMWRRGLKLHD